MTPELSPHSPGGLHSGHPGHPDRAVLAVDPAVVRRHRRLLLEEEADLRAGPRLSTPDAGELTDATSAAIGRIEGRAEALRTRLLELADALADLARGARATDEGAGFALHRLRRPAS